MIKRRATVSLACGLLALALAGSLAAQELKPIKLDPPDLNRGLTTMQAFSARASVRDWSEKDLSLRDLSDVLWAANGVNRADSKKRTAASAMNAQDVDVYVLTKDGTYLYDFAAHALTPIEAGDYRAKAGMRPAGPGGPAGPGAGAPPAGAPPAKPEGPPPAKPGQGPGGPQTVAPVLLVLVSDSAKFQRGAPEMKREMGALDAGIVSGNISLACAGLGLATRPRASMDKDLLTRVLKLKDTQIAFLNHPVGYPKT